MVLYSQAFDEKKSSVHQIPASTPTETNPSLLAADEDPHHLDVDWTDEEESRLVRKLDCLVMPLLMLGFYALQLDRGNIGNAMTDYFLEDVGITQFQFNVGQQLLSAGIVLLEIPSNIILYRIGPQKWISGQIIAWGLVATFQAFQKGLPAYMVTRILLGLCEAGFIPAGLYTITLWYKREETSKRFSWFFIGNLGAVASTGLIGYGILHMRGICNLGGWQWLFILEGLFTVSVGILFTILFPKNPAQPKSILGFRYFSERESQILRKRIVLDDPRKLQKKKWIDWSELKRALSNWTVYPHLLLTMTAVAPNSALNSYAPTLVQSFGYGRLTANALVSVGGWISLILNVSWGYLADHSGRRGPWVTGGIFFWWAFTIGNLCLIHSDNEQARYALLTLALSTDMFYHATNGSWMALNCRSAGERSITMALFIMAANCSGIIGSQLFQADDKPLYAKGWAAIVGLTSAGLFFSVVANVQYWWLNRRLRKKEAGSERDDGDGGEVEYPTETGEPVGVVRYHP
ncbi:alternative sulfate transporter [Saccharata proteae CBS 121410]|uniref:Alternative sulfate transporter n=1 Tax=Saccharata proteae CBS 121410 TaxID=1314787 RepID=A0A9P4LY32_9PEZI|nr:alternative sulfate transporter [Saccharata proteae CBS 121410]